MDRDEVMCDKVFVTLNTELDKVEVLEKFRSDMDKGKSYRKYFNLPEKDSEDLLFDTEITIKMVHEPNEIVWEHIDDT